MKSTPVGAMNHTDEGPGSHRPGLDRPGSNRPASNRPATERPATERSAIERLGIERLGTAMVAAAVGAAVGAVVSRRVPTAPAPRPQPLQLLPINERPVQVQAPVEVDAPQRGDGRQMTWQGPKLAGALSLMAVGALVTMVVLYASGTFGQRVAFAPASAAGPVRETALPVTADDLAAQQGEATDGTSPTEPTAADPSTDPAEAAAPPAPVGDDGPMGDPAVQRANPLFIEIPAIEVSADVIGLGQDATGALEVPQDFAQTGWWTGGPEPGEPGPAVIAGHVDSFEGAAVFFRLDELAYDDLIRVTRTDGSAATYAVRTSIAVDKEAFPTDLVYGATAESELRLITCDGDFSDGSYLGNLIVTAQLLAEHAAPTTGSVR